MNTGRVISYLSAFLLAVIVALVWATIVQVQLNFAVLEDLGHRVPFSLRLQSIGMDLLRFGAFYSVIVIPTFLVAFAVAGLLARSLPEWRTVLFVLAGGIGLMAAIPLVQWASPLALLMYPTRHVSGLALVAAGGLFSGWLFAWMTRDHARAAIRSDTAHAH
jgi:hypothetical protein